MNSTKSTPRRRILNTALKLFHQQGYNSTGINQIIEKSDVAKASLYQIFNSKEELCVEYLTERHDLWFGKLREWVSKPRTQKSKIVAAFDFLYQMNLDEDFRGCSFLNILSEISADEKQILQVIQNHKQDVRNYFKTILPGEKQNTVDHIYLLFESAIIESQLFRNQWPVDRSKKIVVSLLQ
jgi:AcrR family transcriptional regulator